MTLTSDSSPYGPKQQPICNNGGWGSLNYDHVFRCTGGGGNDTLIRAGSVLALVLGNLESRSNQLSVTTQNPHVRYSAPIAEWVQGRSRAHRWELWTANRTPEGFTLECPRPLAQRGGICHVLIDPHPKGS